MPNVFSVFLAAAQAPPAPGGMQQLVAGMMPLVLVFVIMYLLILRPQQTKAKQHSEMVNRLKVGDKIVTSGGIHGTISGVKDRTVMVKVAEKVEMELSRSSVATFRDKEG